MEIIEKFGLDPFLFGAQIINFLIIFYILKRFLYKPTLEVLRKREKIISEGLKQAEEGRKLLEKAQIREKEILKKAKNEARKMIEDAKNQASLVKREIDEEARMEGQRILKETQSQINEQSKEMEKRLVSQISTLSLEFLKKSLSQMFSESEQKEVLDRAVKVLRKPS